MQNLSIAHSIYPICFFYCITVTYSSSAVWLSTIFCSWYYITRFGYNKSVLKQHLSNTSPISNRVCKIGSAVATVTHVKSSEVYLCTSKSHTVTQWIWWPTVVLNPFQVLWITKWTILNSNGLHSSCPCFVRQLPVIYTVTCLPISVTTPMDTTLYIQNIWRKFKCKMRWSNFAWNKKWWFKS